MIPTALCRNKPRCRQGRDRKEGGPPWVVAFKCTYIILWVHPEDVDAVANDIFARLRVV